MDIEHLTMQLIMHGGSARSHAMEAIAAAKEGRFGEARGRLAEADKVLAQAHNAQADLIQGEAEGHCVNLSLLLAHAQDHLMNAITVKDMAEEFVSLYERMDRERNGKGA